MSRAIGLEGVVATGLIELDVGAGMEGAKQGAKLGGRVAMMGDGDMEGGGGEEGAKGRGGVDNGEWMGWDGILRIWRRLSG